MAESLRERIASDMRDAMRAKEKERLGVIRLIHAAIKQREVDERIELNDVEVLAVLHKMAKQRHDSISQYRDAAREDLVAQEEMELEVIQSYLPETMSEVELERLIEQAISDSGATSMQDMGKVMVLLRTRVQGRADMGVISTRVKSRLVV